MIRSKSCHNLSILYAKRRHNSEWNNEIRPYLTAYARTRYAIAHADGISFILFSSILFRARPIRMPVGVFDAFRRNKFIFGPVFGSVSLLVC